MQPLLMSKKKRVHTPSGIRGARGSGMLLSCNERRKSQEGSRGLFELNEVTTAVCDIPVSSFSSL